MVPENPNAPHAAVLFVEYEVHERLPTGELSGSPRERGKKTFSVSGTDLPMCLKKLNDLFEQMRGQ